MSFLNHDISKEYKIQFLNMEEHNKMFHQIKHDENITGQEYLTLMSYDNLNRLGGSIPFQQDYINPTIQIVQINCSLFRSHLISL